MTTRSRYGAGRRTAAPRQAVPVVTGPTVTGPAPTSVGRHCEAPTPTARCLRLRPRDAGMATAEYAVATLAACGFAGLLVAVLSGGEVQEMLLSIVRRALTLE